MKYPKNKCQLFMAILKALVPNPPEKIKKTSFGYSTLGFLKDSSSEVVYDIKHDIVRVSKFFQEYVGGGQYENKEDVKRYKVELKSDRMLLHPLD